MATIMKLGIGRKFYPVLFKWTKYSIGTETIWREDHISQTPPLASGSGMRLYFSLDKTDSLEGTVGEYINAGAYRNKYLDMNNGEMLCIAGYSIEGNEYVFRGMSYKQYTQNCVGSTNYGTVTSTVPDAYPINGTQGGYWYIQI